MRRITVAVAALLACTACGKKEEKVEKKPVVVDAGPPPAPKVELPEPKALPTDASKKLASIEAPADNAITPEKAELGWMLFFDKRLSKDGSKSCSSCHFPDRHYTSPEAVDEKVGGAKNKRNAPTMVNIAYAHNWYWDGRAPTLEAVSEAAWKGQLGADPAEVSAALAKNPTYKALFQRAFNADPSPTNIPQAWATFFRTLQSTESAFDKFEGGDKKAISADAQKGWALFKKKGCGNCHVGPVFTDNDFHRVLVVPAVDGDKGREEATKAQSDKDKFKTPSLRNIAMTGPYFHDGSVKTLDEAIEKMAVGVKKKPRGLDPKLKQGKLAPKEKAQLKAFLESLSSPNTWPAAPEKLPEG